MEVKGKYNLAKVFTENIDFNCINQIKKIVDCKIFEGSKIRLMPDVFTGSTCPVGLTMTYSDKIVPNLVSLDISCGMSYVKIPEVNLHNLDKIIHQQIPSGMNIHKPGKLSNKISNKVESLLNKLLTPLRGKERARILNSVGTLGGGNHFIEVAKSKETNQYYLIVHSGSRNLGLQICQFWQSKAVETLRKHKLDNQGIFEFRDTPESLAYLEDEDLLGYLSDCQIADKFADLNRKAMIELITGKLGIKNHKMEIKTTKHNYVDQNNKIIRKGAISANEGEEVLIPLNMRDGSLLAIGKGNSNWNYSAPHGAGRLISRGKSKELITLDEFVKSMEGIYSTSINESTIDESPMVYKDSKEIESLISDSIEVKEHLIPVYNFKAGSKEL